MSSTVSIGSLGEDLVVKFLMKRGYTILDRNFRKPWGELDIVAQKKKTIHFVEVKSSSQELQRSDVSSETKQSERIKALMYVKQHLPKDRFTPEDRVGQQKSLRLSRIIGTYLKAKHVSDETNWQFDLATVLIDGEKKIAKVNFIDGFIF